MLMSLRYPWLVAIAILPSVGAADIADATTHKEEDWGP
jgi:hypothetical protein